MAALPTGRDGRILAAAILAGVVLAFWLGLVAPVLDWYGDRQKSLLALRQRAAREAALIATLPQLRGAAASAAHAPSQAVLTGDSDAIAGAGLQEQVQGMATTASAQLTSIETLPAEQAGALRRIGVRVELNAQLGVIAGLLKALESATPKMLIDDIRLTGTPVGPQNVQLPLDGAFTVYAFRLGTADQK